MPAAEPCPQPSKARQQQSAQITKEQRMNTCKQTVTTNQTPTAATTGTGTPSPTKPEPTYDQNTASAVIPVDKICYESDDRQFRVEQKVQSTAKYPPSPYPCIVMQFFPEDHTRIRRLSGGGIEVMLTNNETDQFVDAMNGAASASGKGKLYDVLQRVPEKTKQHKAKWKEINEERLGIRKPTGRWWWGKRKQNRKHSKN